MIRCSALILYISMTKKSLTLFQRIVRDYTAVIWICLAAVVLSAIVMLSVPFSMDSYDEWVTSAVFTVGIIIAVASATCIRYLFGLKSIDQATGAKPWSVIWLYPLIVSLVMLPWLLGGVMSDDRTSPLMATVLWLLLAYMALLIGFLLVPFVIVPLELIGYGIVALLGGRRKEAGPMLLLGFYIALVTVFSFVGAFALDDMPSARTGYAHIIFALLGLPGLYSVDNELLLWIARLIALLLIAIPLTFVARDKLAKSRRVAHPNAKP